MKLNVVVVNLAPLAEKLDALIAEVRGLRADLAIASQADQEREEAIMASMDELEVEVQQNTDATNAVETLVTGMAQQLRDLAAQETVDPAELQALADQLESNSSRLSGLVFENTPAAPG